MADHPLRKGEAMPTDELLHRLQVLRPTKGDLVVVTVPEGMGMQAQVLMLDQLRALELGVRLIVLQDGIQLHLIPNPALAAIAQAHYDELHAILAGETNRPPPT